MLKLLILQVFWGGYANVEYTDGTNIHIPWNYNPSDWYSNNIGEWQYVESTISLSQSKTPLKVRSMYIYRDHALAGEIDYAKVKIEQKDTATKYVEDFEEGILLDKTLNNFNVILDSIATPKREYDEEREGGIYTFREGESITTDYKPQQYRDYTFSFWLKKNESIPSYKVILGADSKLGIKLNDSNIAVVFWAENFYVNYVTDLNKWYYITVVYDYTNNKVLLYIDGELISSRNSLTEASWSNDYPIGLGVYGGYLNGEEYPPISLDEVKIYERALSTSEIKREYDLTKK